MKIDKRSVDNQERLVIERYRRMNVNESPVRLGGFGYREGTAERRVNKIIQTAIEKQVILDS